MRRFFSVILALIFVLLTSFSCSSLISYYTDANNSEDMADYYGCPNSKRVRKLNMRKKRKSI